MSDEPKCEACGAVVGPGGALGWCALCVLREAAGLEREVERRGDYEILGEVARGGMGVVYRARQVSLNRVVALKVLLGGGFVGEPGRQRLRSEAAAAARLKHPHIVAVHDAGEWEGQPYFAMEFVAGPTLSEVLRDGPLRLARAVHLVETVARAVHYAHEQGIVHRDLKPSNILLDGEDQPRVADFGLARAEAEAADATRTGTVLGSPAYMPPEQARGQVRRIGPRSDVYSLGAVLYETLTGHPPFLAESPTAVLELVKHTEPVSPRRLNASVPADLETICLRCLEKEPEGRYASAAELAEDLARFRRGEPVRARPLGPVARGLRWARREPALAMVWGLTVALALGSSAAAWWIGRERDVAVFAQRETREALLVARGAQARAVVRSERMGQRREALAAVAEAARIRVTRELRDSAIVALTRWDVQLTNEWTARARQGASWAVAPDLKSEVSETAPGVLSWRDPGTDRVRAVLDGGELGEVVNVPAFDLSGGYVAAAHARGDLAVWRLDAAPRRVLRVDVGAPGVESRRFRPYDFRPGTAEMAVARPGAGLELYSLETGERVRHWPGLGVTNLVRVSPDGLGVAVTSATSLVAVVEIEGTGVRWVSPETGPAEALGWRPDGEELAVGTSSGNLVVLGARDGRVRRELRGHRSRITALVYSGDGRQLWSRSSDSTLRVWDGMTGDAHLVIEDTGPEPDLVIGTAGDRAVMGRQWTEAAWAEIDRVTVVKRLAPAVVGADATLTGMMDFHPDPRWLAVATFRGIGLVDVKRGSWAAWWPRRPAAGDADAPLECSVQFSPDGRTLWMADRTSGVEVRSFEVDGLDRVRLGPARPMFPEPGFLVSDVSTDGRWVALTQRQPGTVVVLDAATGAVVRRLESEPEAMTATFSTDGRWLVIQSTGMDKAHGLSPRVWSTSEWTVERTLDVGPLGLVDFSRDGRWLAVSGERAFRVVEVGRWSNEIRLQAEVPDTSSVPGFAPDGRLLAVGISADVYLARVPEGEVVAKLAALGNNGAATRPRFSPDGRTLAVANDDGTLDLWDMIELRAALGRLGLDW